MDGLPLGRTTLTATARRGHARPRVARLAVTNHPLSGPVFSGPHQEPFFCETQAAGLGPALDRNCTGKPSVRWYARTALGTFDELADPSAPYPAGTPTTITRDGRRVPWVVRVETRTINRGIARLAVLDDPHARGTATPVTRGNWDRWMTYVFGESCHPGYHQGATDPRLVLGGPPAGAGGVSNDALFAGLLGLSDALGKGDLIAYNTLSAYGVHCDPLLSAETLMLMKEWVIDNWGPLRRVIATGGSGGAIQQNNAANSFPGLLEATTPVASFPDPFTVITRALDCEVLTNYFDAHGAALTEAEKTAVTGQRTTKVCEDYRASFAPRFDPTNGCDAAVPMAVRYDPIARPRGVRCTLQDGMVNALGRDPQTGFARRPYDNVGVQYGLQALREGAITPELFLDLNRRAGGFDIDGHAQAARTAMDPGVARRLYRLGFVYGRGAPQRTPTIDAAAYLDLLPSASVHTVDSPFATRARQRARGQTSMAIWRGELVPADVRPAMEQWLDALDRRDPATMRGSARAAVVAATKPAFAADRCKIQAGTKIDQTGLTAPAGVKVSLPLGGMPVDASDGVTTVEPQERHGTGVCATLFPAASQPRIRAGEPETEDVFLCRRKPVDPADYAGRLSGAQLDEARAIFPAGVCDYSRPSVGDVAHSLLYPSIGADVLRRPTSLRWTVGRSRR